MNKKTKNALTEQGYKPNAQGYSSLPPTEISSDCLVDLVLEGVFVYDLYSNLYNQKAGLWDWNSHQTGCKIAFWRISQNNT